MSHISSRCPLAHFYPAVDSAPIALWESGAIVVYLAEKTGMTIGKTEADRSQILKWVMFQMGGLGTMLGQLGYFSKLAGSEIEDPRAKQHYLDEVRRLLAVLEGALADRDWIAGDYSIAAMAIAPWVRALDFYGVKDVVGWNDLKALPAYLDRFLDRPSVQKGLVIPARPS